MPPVSIERALQFRKMSLHQVPHTTLAEPICHCSTLAPARPMAVGNMYQRGYPSHSMIGGHDSVMSICLACHVYTSCCHRLDEMFGAAVFCLQSMSNVYRDLRVMSLSLVNRQGEEGKRTHGQTEQGPSETPSSIFGGELTPPHTTISSELGACMNSVHQVLFSPPMHKAWEQQAVYNVASH